MRLIVLIGLLLFPFVFFRQMYGFGFKPGSDTKENYRAFGFWLALSTVMQAMFVTIQQKDPYNVGWIGMILIFFLLLVPRLRLLWRYLGMILIAIGTIGYFAWYQCDSFVITGFSSIQFEWSMRNHEAVLGSVFAVNVIVVALVMLGARFLSRRIARILFAIFTAYFAMLLIGSIILPIPTLDGSRDSQRRSDVNTILNSIYQYQIDNHQFPAKIPKGTPEEICRNDASDCTGYVDLRALVGLYLVSIPRDPSWSYRHQDQPGTGYFLVQESNGSITVSAPHFESTKKTTYFCQPYILSATR